MKTILLALATLAACGDNIKLTDSGVGGDVGDAPSPIPKAVVVVGDFATNGVLSTLDIESKMIVQNAVTGVAGSDPMMRQIGNELLVVNRFNGDNVTILDAKTLMLKDQLSTGTGSNPQDVAVLNNKLYLPALGTKGVVVLTRGSTQIKTIDIGAAIAEPDGDPDCVSAYLVGSELFVACGLLTSFVPRAVGKIVVIDTTNDTVKRSFDMPYKNPQGIFTATPASSTFSGDLLISTVPNFADTTQGCVVRVSANAASCAITNQMLGAPPSHMAVQTSDQGGALLWMAVSHYDSMGTLLGNLRGYDLVSASLWPMPTSPATQTIVDVAVCPNNFVVVADAKMNAAGLRIYEGGIERTTTPLAVGLPSFIGNQLACFDAR